MWSCFAKLVAVPLEKPTGSEKLRFQEAAKDLQALLFAFSFSRLQQFQHGFGYTPSLAQDAPTDTRLDEKNCLLNIH